MSIQSRVLCVVGHGFEEIETVTPVDILRRAGVEVVLASAASGHQVIGRSGIRLEADEVLHRHSPFEFNMLLLPGGPGVTDLRQDGRVASLIREFHDHGRWIAAICAAPLLLKDAGILDDRKITCHQSARPELPDALLDQRVVEDGKLITSRGAGTSLDFALTLVRRLTSAERAQEIAEAIMA